MKKPLLKPQLMIFSLAMGLILLNHVQICQGQLFKNLITNNLSPWLCSLTLPVWKQSCRDEKIASLASMSQPSEMGVTSCTNAEDSKLGAWIYFSFNKSKFLLDAPRQNFKKCVIPFSIQTPSPSEIRMHKLQMEVFWWSTDCYTKSTF